MPPALILGDGSVLLLCRAL